MKLDQGFQFYDQGTVRPDPSAPVTREPSLGYDSLILGYQLHGDVRGAFVLIVPGGMDADLYAELGNCLAGKWCEDLSDQDLDVLISSPDLLAMDGLMRLEDHSRHKWIKSFVHDLDSTQVRLEARLYLYDQVNSLNH